MLETRYPSGHAQSLSSVEEEEVLHMLASGTLNQEGIEPETHRDT